MNPIQKEKKHLKNKIAKQDSLNKKIGEHGVTIMALVITIIVLLILAGITIQMSLNDNDYKTSSASKKYI